MNPFQKLPSRVRSILSSSANTQELSQGIPARITPHSPEELSFYIALEHLRQARCSFNLSLIVITASTIVGFTGAGLLLSGKTTEGAVAAAGGAFSSICHLQLVKEANDRLEKSGMALKRNK